MSDDPNFNAALEHVHILRTERDREMLARLQAEQRVHELYDELTELRGHFQNACAQLRALEMIDV